MVEFADINNKAEIKELWESIFREDEKVIDVFFEKIFPFAVIPVIKTDGKIVSSLFLLDCTIGAYKGKCVYCAMTKNEYRGKGYMKMLLDYSYVFCKNNGYDFLVLVPAEKSLFDYYSKCGFEKFGFHRKHFFDGNTPYKKEKLEIRHSLEFHESICDYWKNSCRIYGGKVTDFGLIFNDDTVIIRNADCDFEEIPEEYNRSGNIIQGNITFGEDFSPAMIKTENAKIKKIKCYIGITLE